MTSVRDSVIPFEDIEVIQYRRSSRRYSQLVDETKKVAEDVATAQKRKVSLSIIAGRGPGAPDGGYGWVIVFCSFMLNLIIDGIALAQGIFVQPLLVASNGTISEFEIGWINGCETGVTLLVGPIATVLVNRYGYRFSVILGTLITALAILLSWACSPTTPSIIYLILFYGVFTGLGHGLVFAPSVVIVTHYFDKKRALATGMAICGTGMGTFIMNPLSAHLITEIGWGGALLAQSGIVLTCLIFGGLLKPPPSHISSRSMKVKKNYAGSRSIPAKLTKIYRGEAGPDSERRPSLAPSPEETAAGRRNSSADWNEFKEFLTSPTYWIIALSGALIMLGFFVPFFFLPERAKTLTTDLQYQSYLLSAAGIANVVGRILFGFLSDRPWVNNLALNNFALTIGGIATALSPLIQSYYLLMAYCTLFGFCIACFATLRSIIIHEFVGSERMNNGFGLSLLFMGVTSLFGTPLAGLLRDLTGSYEVSFVIAGVFILISGIICYPLRYIDTWERNRKITQFLDE